ncbi:hypothetical protein HXX76_013337 [Chlamydomonas incerta]|uniref:Uncharacterized protein n=1 Tax=Chlamydomonas incerta TaxID=51695 RepID=A0A835VUT7_CHLIN|nr:hypothetical protein HXX76_013337 [Chlamydomonas incerta]|eukprot:KAG2425966.1 hypothetical protein HXX76_013337 [Chlamydomonas incerta]
MTHVLESRPISFDTRCFGAGLPPPSLPAGLCPHSVTLRVALTHESKARAWPCEARLAAALDYLADGGRSRFQQGQLQLQLPLRCALPASTTAVLASRFHHLTRLRLVRCSLTQQLAAALGGLAALRRLCIAHASLAALPQLLAAATQLEHLHVHGYHSLVIVEDNAHLAAAWRAAAALVVAAAAAAPAPAPAPAPASAPATAAGVAAGAPGWTGGAGAAGAGGGAAAAGGGGAAAGHGARRRSSGAEALAAAEAGSAPGPAAGGEANGDAQGAGAGAGAGVGAASAAAAEAARSGRLRCLAVCAQHLYHDAVLDETELDFESEALQWQMRWVADDVDKGLECRLSTSGGGGGSGGRGGGGSDGGGWESGVACGCAADPHEDPSCPGGSDRGQGAQAHTCSGGAVNCRPGGSSNSSSSGSSSRGCGGSSIYAGGAGGSVALCAGALVGLRCDCCCSSSGGQWAEAQTSALSRRRMSAAGVGTTASPAVDEGGGLPAAAALAPAGPADAVAVAPLAAAGAAAAPVAPPPPPRTPEALAAAAATATAALRLGLQLLKSGKREVRLLPPEALAAAVAPPAAGQPPPLQWRHLQYVQLALSSGGVEAEGDDAGGGGGPEGEGPVGANEGQAVGGPGAANGGGLGAAPPPPPPQLSTPATGCDGAASAGSAMAAALGGASLAALAALPDLRGIWCDPDEYDHEELELESGAAVGGAAAADPMDADAGADAGGPGRPAAGAAAAAAAVAAPWRCSSGGGGGVHGCRLRSLALGDRRTPFLGVGDDTAAALAALRGLTKLHLAAAYTLPLSAPAPASPALPLTPQHRTPAAAPPPPPLALPPRLAPLGALAGLQRLSLHFANPLGRPAEVCAVALPSSLVSLALHGVVLRPQLPGQVRGVEAAAAAAAGSPAGVSGVSGAAAAGDGVSGGGCLPRLRELSLSSSFVAAPSRLGCSGALRVLSLRDSGLGIEPEQPQQHAQQSAGNGCGGHEGSGGVGAGDGGARQWAALLRRWHGLQTVRLVGSSATAAPGVLLPHGDAACVDVHSPLALHVLVRCLPGLRMLALSPPPPPPPSPAVEPEGGAPRAAAARGSTNGAADGSACGADADADAEPAAAAVLRLLPSWRLTALGQDWGQPQEDGGGAGGGEGAPAGQSEAEAAAAAAVDDVLTGGPGTDAQAAAAVAGSGADAAEGAASSGGGGGSGSATELAPGSPASWLLLLLRLLAQHSPHLTCLRVAAAAADRDAAEAAVRTARALLPRSLPRLDSLALTLDLAAAHVAAHPHPEACARDWAAWLRPQEVALQERMRFTCVSLTPHPNAASRAREVARARLLQQQQHLQQLQQARQLQQ